MPRAETSPSCTLKSSIQADPFIADIRLCPRMAAEALLAVPILHVSNSCNHLGRDSNSTTHRRRQYRKLRAIATLAGCNLRRRCVANRQTFILDVFGDKGLDIPDRLTCIFSATYRLAGKVNYLFTVALHKSCGFSCLKYL